VNLDSLGIEPLIPPVLGVLKLDGPAYKAGMKQGDRVLQIDGQKVANWNEMVERVRESGGAPLQFVWVHEGNTIQETLEPDLLYDESSKDSIWQIGVIMPLERRHIPIASVVSISAQEGVNLIWLTLKTVYQLVIGRISRRALGGPIAIFRLSGESVRWGFEYLLRLLAIISINLGLINLFPIPVLDGGHVVISLIEAVRRKRFSRRTRMVIQQIGYAIILLLIVFVTFNDITR
jgi:regulator of sigma E protease